MHAAVPSSPRSSLKPRHYALGLYLNTLSWHNMLATRTGVLQVGLAAVDGASAGAQHGGRVQSGHVSVQHGTSRAAGGEACPQRPVRAAACAAVRV